MEDQKYYKLNVNLFQHRIVYINRGCNKYLIKLNINYRGISQVSLKLSVFPRRNELFHEYLHRNAFHWNSIMPRIMLAFKRKDLFHFLFRALTQLFRGRGTKITSEPAVLESLQFKSSLAEIRVRNLGGLDLIIPCLFVFENRVFQFSPREGN